MFRGLLIIFFIGVSFASRSANQYIENVIQTSLPDELRFLGLDPAPINNIIVTFGSKSEGDAIFTNGNISGLAGVKRYSECSGPSMIYGAVSINCTLKFYPLTANYRVAVSNRNFTSYAHSVGNVEETLAYVKIIGKPPNYVGLVWTFQITHLGVVNPTFSGLSPVFKKYLNSIKMGYRATVLSYLYNAIQQRFEYAFGRALANKPMPKQ